VTVWKLSGLKREAKVRGETVEFDYREVGKWTESVTKAVEEKNGRNPRKVVTVREPL